MIQIKWVATRPDTLVAFYWDSTDPKIVETKQLSKEYIEKWAVSHSRVISEDKLILTISRTFDSLDGWLQCKDLFNADPEETISIRNKYFSDHGHTLVVFEPSVNDADVIINTTLV